MEPGWSDFAMLAGSAVKLYNEVRKVLKESLDAIGAKSDLERLAANADGKISAAIQKLIADLNDDEDLEAIQADIEEYEKINGRSQKVKTARDLVEKALKRRSTVAKKKASGKSTSNSSSKSKVVKKKTAGKTSKMASGKADVAKKATGKTTKKASDKAKNAKKATGKTTKKVSSKTETAKKKKEKSTKKASSRSKVAKSLSRKPTRKISAKRKKSSKSVARS